MASDLSSLPPTLAPLAIVKVQQAEATYGQALSVLNTAHASLTGLGSLSPGALASESLTPGGATAIASAAQLIAANVPPDSAVGKVAGVLSTTGTFAASGAALGPVGAIVGAVVGAVLGIVETFFGHAQGPPRTLDYMLGFPNPAAGGVNDPTTDAQAQALFAIAFYEHGPASIPEHLDESKYGGPVDLYGEQAAIDWLNQSTIAGTGGGRPPNQAAAVLIAKLRGFYNWRDPVLAIDYYAYVPNGLSGPGQGPPGWMLSPRWDLETERRLVLRWASYAAVAGYGPKDWYSFLAAARRAWGRYDEMMGTKTPHAIMSYALGHAQDKSAAATLSDATLGAVLQSVVSSKTPKVPKIPKTRAEWVNYYYHPPPAF